MDMCCDCLKSQKAILITPKDTILTFACFLHPSRPDKDSPRIAVPQSLQAYPETHGDLQRERFHT